MSKIGKQKINIPKNVNVQIQSNILSVKGPKGNLKIFTFESLNFEIFDSYIKVTPKEITKKSRAVWGLARALVNNMIIGVHKGFKKSLIINGVGYKANIYGDILILSLGFSHEIMYSIPKTICIECVKNTIKISGCDKQLVGQVSADIKKFRKLDPYKGKGIKYEDESILRKTGKKK